MKLRIAEQSSPRGTLQWDETSCLLCGRDNAEILLEARDANPGERPPLQFAVVKCKDCSLIYTNPRPDTESIGSFYPTDYRPHRRPRKMREAGRSSRMSRWTGRAVPERDGSLPWVGLGRLLDFGCGGGSYMKRMADQGWTVTGLDAAVGAVRSIQEELGLKAIVGTLPHPDLEPGTFDVITMWHSLEHVHQPREILREAFDLLVPGGKLVVACPNIDSWAFRQFQSSWFALDVPRHLIHFTPTTLREMLTISGFNVEQVRLIRHSDWLRSSARLADRNKAATFLQRGLLWKPLAKLTAWWTHVRNSSDCMLAVAERPV